VSLFSLLLTQMMAGIVILPSLYTMYSKLKLVDSPYGLVFVLMAANLALAVWVLYGFFQTLPKEIEEAALIDGCSYVGTLIRIIVPISGPGVAVGAIFVFINSYNEFVIPLFLLTDARFQTITMALYSLLTDTTMRWELLAGCSLVVIIPPVIIFLLFERYIVSGLTSGAVKN
jgi:ABC-type glycerol-3-phosphate transport system permease component